MRMDEKAKNIVLSIIDSKFFFILTYPLMLYTAFWIVSLRKR